MTRASAYSVKITIMLRVAIIAATPFCHTFYQKLGLFYLFQKTYIKIKTVLPHFVTLKDDAKTSLENFDSVTSEQIVSVLSQVKSHFKSELTREYLEGKLAGIKKAQSEQEKKSLCKNLKPYLDWYVQGKM